MSLEYAWEKFHVAVLGLARSSGSLQERLEGAYLSALGYLKHEDVPADLQPQLSELQHRLTSEEAIGDEGTLRTTLRKMDEHEAARIIQQIVSMYDQVAQELGRRDGLRRRGSQ